MQENSLLPLVGISRKCFCLFFYGDTWNVCAGRKFILSIQFIFYYESHWIKFTFARFFSLYLEFYRLNPSLSMMANGMKCRIASHAIISFIWNDNCALAEKNAKGSKRQGQMTQLSITQFKFFIFFIKRTIFRSIKSYDHYEWNIYSQKKKLIHD